MRRSQQSAFANPVLIGAATMLVLLVAVFLAYNANQGLPFVPTRELKVDIANGAALNPGNEVREGGYLIGLVSEMKPVRLSGGLVGAQLTLKLNRANGRVPVDSTVSIRPGSVLGLKYVDLHKGTATRAVPDGGTLPIAQSTVPVQFDDILKTFNPPTRVAVQANLVGFGDALASRGSALNDTFAALPALFGHLAPVAQDLSDPRTGLTHFIDSLQRFSGTLAPVAQTTAQLFTVMATTFAAISRDPSALEATIAESPPTLAVGTASLRIQQPFLADLTTLGQQLSPATAQLDPALTALNPAIAAGTKTLARTPTLNANLEQVMNALEQLALAPGTNVAVNGLTATVDTLNPTIRYLGPFQTVCDDWNYWWTYLSEHLSAQTSYGYAQRALINLAPAGGTNSVGALGATGPADGQVGSDSSTGFPFGGVEFLHAQPYGAAVDNQGNADCETGQRGYPLKLSFGDPQGRDIATDNHTPGDQGPTFSGRSHVPAGETFSRNPQTGPQLPYVPTNP